MKTNVQSEKKTTWMQKFLIATRHLERLMLISLDVDGGMDIKE